MLGELLYTGLNKLQIENECTNVIRCAFDNQIKLSAQ